MLSIPEDNNCSDNVKFTAWIVAVAVRVEFTAWIVAVAVTGVYVI